MLASDCLVLLNETVHVWHQANGFTVSCIAAQALEFGMKYQGTYMDSELAGLKDHAEHYPSSGYIDELAWGNIWVYWATSVSTFEIWCCLPTFRSLPNPLSHASNHLVQYSKCF